MSLPYPTYTVYPPLPPSTILTGTTVGTSSFLTATGQVVGEKARSRKSTPPDVGSRGSGDLDRTPSARAKVLPWVQDVQVEGYEPPEGMLGPYDSQPPTRPPTFHQPQTAPKHPHPFAYNAGSTIPFSALAGDTQPQHDGYMGSVESLLEKKHGARHRPESDVLSRGAGVKYLNQPQAAGPGGSIPIASGMSIAGTETPIVTGSRGSPGMGTFGREASMEPLRPQETERSPRKPVPAYPPQQRQPPGIPLPPSPEKTVRSSETHRQTPIENPAQQEHHHQPHHDFPFSHHDAAKKQLEAMEAARAQALSQLEAATQQHLPTSADTDTHKGPRETFQTSTSGPSFGHIMTQGLPRLSLQVGGPPPGATAPTGLREFDPDNRPSFMHIPFGVPMGVSVPRPMMVMRNSAGVGLGIGIGGPRGVMGLAMNPSPGLTGVAERSRTPDARSAYVETVEDEQEPTILSAKSPRMKSNAPTPPDQEPGPAKTESGLQPDRSSYDRVAKELRGDQAHIGHPTKVDTTRSRKIATPAHTQHNREHHEVQSKKSRSRAASKAPTVQSQRHPELNHEIVEASPTVRNVSPLQHEITPTRPLSFAPTTASNVKQLVSESKFHDEALCQLLDAARLNLIGSEAKKALQRAARARVIELREMREGAEIAMPPISPPRKEKRDKSKERQRKVSEDKGKLASSPPQPTTPPAWAQDIINRLEQFDSRFAELEKTKNIHDDEITPPSQDLAGDLIDELIFHDQPSSGFSPNGIASLGINHFGQGFPPGFPPGLLASLGIGPPLSSRNSQGAFIQTLPSERPSDTQHTNDVPSWGSEVELPHPGVAVPPPRAPPTINIQPPTESNVGGKSSRVQSRVASTQAKSDSRTPRQVNVEIIEERISQAPDTAQLSERDLPPLPQAQSEGNRSYHPSPISNPSPQQEYSHRTQHTPTKAPTSAANGNQSFFTAQQTRNPTAVVEYAIPNNRASTIRERVTVVDPINPVLPNPAPWELVTQRLYSWALVWEEESFVRALEGISLGKQIEEFPLTVYTMMTFKRNISRLMTNSPPLPCDKLFVPPNMADAINKAVHAKRFNDAQQILEELWYPFGMDSPPRIIIALSRHRNELDNWTAHRYDLTTGHLTSYSVSHEEKALIDGRPFMWWHAIRQAWPDHHIPHPDHLHQRVERIHTKPENRNDNSLVAVNISRNLLLGWRPERGTDLVKLRELVWAEVKRLLKRKRQGTLIVSMDSPDHVYEV